MLDPAQACEALLARLFTDPGLRSRFRADPIQVGRELGLDERDLATLERTDWVGLELAARGYAHKHRAHAARRRPWWRRLKRALRTPPSAS